MRPPNKDPYIAQLWDTAVRPNSCSASWSVLRAPFFVLVPVSGEHRNSELQAHGQVVCEPRQGGTERNLFHFLGAGTRLRDGSSASKPGCPELCHLLESADSQAFPGR